MQLGRAEVWGTWLTLWLDMNAQLIPADSQAEKRMRPTYAVEHQGSCWNLKHEAGYRVARNPVVTAIEQQSITKST